MAERDGYILRPMETSDLETVWKWRNSLRIRREMYTDHEISWEEHTAWFRCISETGTSLHYVFEAHDRKLGVVNVVDISQTHSRCHWGFYIGETDAPRGSGTIMGFLALEHLFEELDFHRVIGEAIASNGASIKYHKRLGFQEEGRLIDHACKNGYYIDVIAMAIIKDRWLRIKPRLEEKFFTKGGKQCLILKSDNI
ncbi:MAG: UDP-4-amino-4,6-dideoxy-N-acetyl-beta-L-altrosamine N-acetyltransferase [Candidatus Zixiibacteriota bacterium]